MSSVYFPAHVVLVLRRIVNVISSLSISNQYLLIKQDRARARAQSTSTSTSTSTADAGTLNPPSSRAVDVEWPKWDWPRLVLLDAITQSSSRYKLKTEGICLPWIGGGWSWSAMLSTSTQQDTTPSAPLPPLPSPPKRDQTQQPQWKLEREKEREARELDTIHQLMQHPALYEPLRTPRYPIVLCHGLYGFNSRGPQKFPSMRMHYWSNVLNILRNTVRAEVIVTSVPGTGSITSRAETLDRQLQHKAQGRGINFVAHSMGGLDCRHLITHLKPETYAPLSLTTISTPHRGSPFMDWCAENIGIGKLRQHEQDLARSRGLPVPPLPPPASPSPTTKDAPFSLSLTSLPSSFTTLLLSVVDSPAYANLTSAYLNDVFNPRTPDDPTVKYFSVAGRMDGVSVWHPFWLPKMVLDGVEQKRRGVLRAMWEQETDRERGREVPLWARESEWGNDGLVTVQSAKWGEFLGIMEGCDHWEMRGARGIEFGVDLPAIPSIGLGVSTAGHRTPSTNGNGKGNGGPDGWSFRDWGRFVGAWRKEEKIQQDAAARAAKDSASSSAQPTQSTAAEVESEREKQRDRDDAVLKSSTDKLSAVLDWLTEQVPLGNGRGKDKAKDLVKEREEREREHEGKTRRNELATKKDLERFYVALSKKLYDEGL
ncbi:Lipase 2 [Hypsizygus marmoreus]|uniref:Lipase 2 n=1 Tax=Hypsizygus marmoreus TaxID=39966 RepID=A0A369JCW8_HYPMA|nr:Lipase 2 [Hypsizygus marmoreus]